MASMRREWLAANRNSEKECPVKRFEDYDEVSQRAITRSILMAVQSAGEKGQAGYERYRVDQGITEPA